MAQSDLNVANADGATVRADINSQLEALATQNSGPTAPPVTFPFMRWFDTANQQLKERNSANTAWRVVAEVVNGELVPYSAGESADDRYARLAEANDFSTMPTVGGHDLIKARDSLGGSAQSWQDVTASRSAGVSYTNSTGRPIMVIVSAQVTSNAVVEASVGGAAIARSGRTSSTTGLDTVPIAFIVPNGSNYQLSTSGTVNIPIWRELR